MTNNNCQYIQARFASLLSMLESHQAIIEGEVDRQRIEGLLLVQKKIEHAHDEIKEMVVRDKYQVELRDKIAKNHGLSFVSAFNSHGSAIGIPKDPSKNELEIVMKSGPPIHKHTSWFHKKVNKPGDDRYGVKRMSFVDMADDMFLVKVHCIDNETIGNEVDRFVFLDELGSAVGQAFDKAYPFSEGVAVVLDESDGKDNAYIMKKTGETIQFPEGYGCDLLSDRQFHNNRLVATHKENPNQFIYLDQEGNIGANGMIFAHAEDFSEGVAAVKPSADGKWIYIDPDGQDIFPETEAYEFDEATGFSDGIATVRQGTEWYIIKKDGTKIPITNTIKSLLPANQHIEDTTPYVKEGIVHVKNSDLSTIYIDQEGSQIGFGLYQKGSNFNEGFASTRWKPTWDAINGGEGYIDKEGSNRVITDLFSKAGPFHHGVAQVKKDTKTYYIDQKGRRVFAGDSNKK